MREINLIGGCYESSSLPWSAQDTVNWLPVQAGQEGARSPMKLKGVPGLIPLFVEPAPPPGAFVTSRPYPVVAVEALDSGIDLVTVRLLAPISSSVPPEAIDSGASVVSAQLREILRAYAFTEAMESTTSIVSAELRTVLEQYTAPPEALDSTASVNSGELKAILISYAAPAEALDSTASVLSGTLA